MDQNTFHAQPTDWTSFESYAATNNQPENFALIIPSAPWIKVVEGNKAFGVRRISNRRLRLVTDQVRMTNASELLSDHLRLMQEYNRTLTNKLYAGNGTRLLSVDQLRLAYLAQVKSTELQPPAVQHIAELVGALTESVTNMGSHETLREKPRVYNVLAVGIFLCFLASAVAIFLAPNVGIVFGLIAFVGVSILGARVDAWKATTKTSAKTHGI